MVPDSFQIIHSRTENSEAFPMSEKIVTTEEIFHRLKVRGLSST
jgi:hypothetical protein